MHCHILPLIIEYLSKERKSLLACLKVNRLWCRAVVPVLWSDPFRYASNYKDKFPEVIFIYLGCLEKNAKQKFLSQIPADKKSLFKTPIFDYVKFLKHFNYWMIDSSIKEAARKLGNLEEINVIYTSPDSKTQLFYFNDNPPLEGVLRTHLLNLIYNRSNRLNYFTIADHFGFGHILDARDYNQFGHVMDGDFLEPIKKISFCIDYSSLYKVFSWIPDICPNVKHLKFRLKCISDSDAKTITKVLSKFKDLRTFKLKVNYREEQQEEKLPSIANHIHSLTTIVIRHCNFKKNNNLIQEIAQCKSLVELKILLCTGLTTDKAKVLINADFPMLKIVELWGNYCKEAINWAKIGSKLFFI
ncbi:3448_t:CDS:2 [Cetraspora pellucida]|uniref:3448_t:CDS:1 n=1 Tax=Cetraspora pellucida TaxID=1433469 RepID=A0A9N9GAD1_9GLOM|nr:3448_t:CDS:2 [Cetraspora pellucida]